MRHEVHRNVPKVLVECVTLLERGEAYMETCGLYRVSGNHTTIQKLRFKVCIEIELSCHRLIVRINDSNFYIQIDANNYKLLHEQKDPHNITGVVKLFFRELKHPIITLSQLYEAIPDADDFLSKNSAKKQKMQSTFRSNYASLRKVNSSRAIQIAKVKGLYQMLAKINQDTLEYLIMHIAK